jgi:hypothetical protein
VVFGATQTFALGLTTPILFAFGALFASMALGAARCAEYGNILASATSLLVVAGFDPLNDAGTGVARGRELQAGYDLACYGAIPFLMCGVVLPRFDVLILASLVHSVCVSNFALFSHDELPLEIFVVHT